MILPISSVSRTADLLSVYEEEILAALIGYITQRTDQAKQNLVSVLSKLISTSYYMGGDRAAKEIGHQGPLGLAGLDPVMERLGTSLDTTFGSMSGELTDIIKGGIRNGWSYDHVQQSLAEKLRGGWGDSIKFDSTGTVRKIVTVGPDGKLSWGKKTITQSVTLPTDVYADTLARTSMKQAYTAGHFAQYEDAGYEGWVYLSVADERTRPRHLALHGRVFLFGTSEEEMARKVMEEHNCRCRPKAWFNNVKWDRPESAYAAERKDWSTKTFDEWKVDKNMPLFMQENPQNVKDLHSLKSKLADRMQGNDWQILGHQMGLSSKDMARDTIQTLDENFFNSKKFEGFSFVHIQEEHAASEGFGISDVLKVRTDGERIGRDSKGLHIIGDIMDGRQMHVVISEEKRKIVTAHISNKRYLKGLMKRVEKVDYDY